MKKAYIFSPLLFLGVALLWMSASNGVAKIQGKDRTGSPVSDNNCTACHSSGQNFSTISSVIVKDASGQLVTEYSPGSTYIITVDIQSTGNAGHGFQLTGLLSNNSAAGTCTATSPNTQITALNGRWYFEHTVPNSGGSYEMKWVAPAAGSGDVTLYGSTLSINGDGSTSGDEFMNIPNVVITESVANSVAEEINKSMVTIFPNPTTDYITVDLGSEVISNVEVYSITGSLVMTTEGNAQKQMINVSNLKNGNYFVRVIGSGSTHSSTFIKE